MAKATWKGSISLGLINVPVGAIATAESSENISFNQLHKGCDARIAQKKICSKCDKEVPTAELVKGYEYTKGQYVVIPDEDIAGLRIESDRQIKIEAFVEDQLDPLMIDKTYYLVPDSKIPGPYFVMQQAMQGKLGIGKITLNGKERQVAISTRGNGFLMYTLLTKAEIRQADALEQLQHVPKVNEDEVRMAHMLIDRLVVDEYDLESFEDSYKKAVRAVIEARVKGEAPTVQAAIADPQATTSLMDALKSMLDTVQPSAKKQQQAKAVLPMPKAKPQVVAMAARRTTKKVAK